MNEFKIGDQVYIISYAFDSNDPKGINIECLKINRIDDAQHYSSFEFYYKSHREALEALAQRLNHLLKEDKSHINLKNCDCPTLITWSDV